MTPKQCRAARMAVGLSEHALGKAAGFRKITVTLFETRHLTPAATCQKLRQVLEAAGIEFLATDGNTFGVRLREAAK